MISPRDFYRIPWIASALLQQCYWRYLSVRFPFGLRRHFNIHEINSLNRKSVQLFRPTTTDTHLPFFELHKADGDIEDPSDIYYYIEQGAVEFIPEVSTVFDMDRSDVIIIDLDPKGSFSWHDIRYAMVLTHEYLCKFDSPLAREFVVENWKFRFSGNRSFHLYIKLQRPYEFKIVKEYVKKSLDPLVARFPDYLTYDVKTAEGKIYIDIGAMAKHRCVRSLWSLHHKTGMVCVPIFNNVMEFDLNESIPDRVIARGPVSESF